MTTLLPLLGLASLAAFVAVELLERVRIRRRLQAELDRAAQRERPELRCIQGGRR